jgi:hypothetical protein
MEFHMEFSGKTKSGRGDRRFRSSDEPKGSPEVITGWVSGRLPDGWFVQGPKVTIDNDEILIVGLLSAPDTANETDPTARAATEAGRISRFREETREERMAIAREGQHHFGRSVSWGVEIGETKQIFTHLSMPVMTRLRQSERSVLDTLVDSGVARSRSDALAWCVKLVAANADEWLLKLRDAMESVETIRQQGPLS